MGLTTWKKAPNGKIIKSDVVIAKTFAESEFEKYRPLQDKLFESDFDREIKKLIEGKKWTVLPKNPLKS